jgi:hypothetical protein
MAITDLADDDGADVDGKTPPSSKIVDWLHGNASLSDPQSIHHRVGTGEADASPGNHRHNGRDSFSLFDEVDIPDDLSNSATNSEIVDGLNAVLALLRTVGG